MALPMRKEPERFVVPPPPTREEVVARADALRKKLGRELRTEIDGPLTEEEWEEVVIANAESGERIPLDGFFDEMRAEGLMATGEEREKILAELRTEGLLPPGR